MSNFIPAAVLCLAFPFAFSCGGGDHEGTHTHSDGTVHEGEHGDEPGETEESAATNDHAAEMEEKGAVDLGTVMVGGATLAIDASGPAEPGSVVTLNVNLAEGSMPETIRLWYGLESAVGSLKAKGDAHDDHFHADVEIPEGAMEGAALWVETVSSGGDKETMSLKF